MKTLNIFVCLLLAVFNSNFIESRNGVGFGAFNPINARHGGVYNERRGGTCEEFLNLNGLNTCCANREDDCYMIHYDTRCYCDNFCDRAESDCCPDALSICQNGHKPPRPTPGRPTTTTVETTTTTTPEPITEPIPDPTTPQPAPDTSGFYPCCEKNGEYYQEGDTIEDNCNTCTCNGERWFCSDNKCLINVKLLSDINNSGKSWRAGNYTKFWGKPLNYGYKHRLGTRLPKQKQKPFDPYFNLNLETLNKPLPSSYDFREDSDVKEFLRRRPVRDQGDCAASWAFSTVDVATDRLVKVTKGKHGNRTSYSVQQLISCAILKNDQDGCSPSTTDVAWNFINHVTPDGGLVEESCQEYKNGDKDKAIECQISKLSDECPDKPERPFDGSTLSASPVYPLKVTSEDDIKREILSQGPVQAIFKVYSDFFMYTDGVYQWSRLAPEYNHKDPYHSVKILGWGRENGVDYWLCANSWGDDWGLDGYFKIKRGEAEINDHIFAAWGNGKVNGKAIFNQKMLSKHVNSMYASALN